MKASVCMASFNRDPELLRRVFRSIFAQHPPFEFEVIVADDGSEYGAPDVCKEFDIQYVRIDREPVARCPAATRNVAYRLAKGEIIIAQSDDVVHETPNAIEQLCGILEVNPQTFVIANVFALDKDGNRTVYTGPHGVKRKPYFFLGALWKRDLYSIGGDDEDFTRSGGCCYEDKWFAHCLMEGRKLKPIFIEAEQVTGIHQYHESRFSNEPNRNYNHKTRRINQKVYIAKRDRARRTGVWCAVDGPWE